MYILRLLGAILIIVIIIFAIFLVRGATELEQEIMEEENMKNYGKAGEK